MTGSKGGKPQGRPAQGRPRTGARVAAVQALFQSEQAEENAETVIDQFTRHRLGKAAGTESFEEGRVPDAHLPLFSAIVRAAVLGQPQIDQRISEHLPTDWPFERLDPVLRALLRAAAAELSMTDGPPVRVVINEYLDVAHGFFHGDEPKLVNGLLDTLGREARPGEFAAAAPADLPAP
ncbi:transcription antitermination factor NusB [Acidisoma cellulosilytica]|uniref:Transcription antitermination protein NusB n=1 Tax=Acidisoma cellulosilyticum TaxID=2802395 RepID=A0A963Z4T9_9PROT|nr:transcription antitermination factor NusB [Acidisoma cellulosilyticum]MCB8882829.1 transcription antitermination factor NusB [Acidisoma cellulosilyticum]